MNEGAKLLRAWRDRRGISQAQAGELAGIPTRLISRLERGEYPPKLDAAAKLNAAAKIPFRAWLE